MRHKHLSAAALALGAALGLAACSADATAPVAAEPLWASAAANGVSNPNTPVSAQVVVTVGGSITYRSSGVSNNGLGTCQPVGVYYNPTNRKTSGKEHPQCATITGGATFTVTFSETANYVLPPSGNVQLNFAPAAGCDPLADPFQCNRAIEFKKNQNVTLGFGVLATTETAYGSGLWTIDLGAADQPFAKSGNYIDPAGTLIVACNATYGCQPGLMTW